jgi:hypothetical protein
LTFFKKLTFDNSAQKPNFIQVYTTVSMKNVFIAFLTLASVSLFAQPAKKGKEMTMTPEFSKGYYLPMKGDTVKGEVQNNRDKETDFYTNIMFKAKGASKATEITTKKAKGYGYDDNHFSALKMDDKEVYIKLLEQGRLNLMEWKYEDKEGKAKAVYFIIDTRATAEDKSGTNVLTQLNEVSHKKILKPFFKDQPILLDQVDKWYFKLEEVRKAVSEFNAMYP